MVGWKLLLRKIDVGRMGAIDDLIVRVLDPGLEAAGFQRKRRTWNRLRMGFVDVVDVQTVPRKLGPNTFTMNVGVLVPDLYELVHGRTPPRFAEDPECVVRVRVGELLNRGGADRFFDRWWTLDSDTEQLNAERELGDALPGRVLPFLERFQSMPDVHTFLETQTGYHRKYGLDRLFLAAARHRVGDVEGALRELTDVRHKDRAWGRHAESVERRLRRNDSTRRSGDTAHQRT